MNKIKRFFQLLGMLLGILLLMQSPVLEAPAQGQEPEGPGIDCRAAAGLYMTAITRNDLLLLANGGVVSGKVLAAAFPFQPTSGSAVELKRKDLLVITFGQTPKEPDRVLKAAGELLSGQLQLNSVEVKLFSGEQVTLPRSQIDAIVFQADEPLLIFRGPFGSALRSRLLQSLTKTDLVAIRGEASGQGLGGGVEALLSASLLDKEFPFVEASGQRRSIPKEQTAVLTISDQPGSDLALLKTGGVLRGTLEIDTLRLQPAYSSQESQLSKGQIKLIIFQMLPAQCMP